MKHLDQQLWMTLGGLALLAAAGGQVLAQSYPAGPVRVIVPFPAGGGVDGMLSGEASIMFMPTVNAVPLVRAGRLRALAVTSPQRLPAMPGLPTVAESGLKGYPSSQWYGILAPAGTPVEILNLLGSHIMKIRQSAEMKQRMTDGGSVAVGSTREAFATHIREEFARWAKVIKASGARVD